MLHQHRDENFGNARQVRTLFEKIIQQQAIRLVDEPDSDTQVIQLADIDAILPELNIANADFSSHKQEILHNALAELDNMIGLQAVKQEVHNLVSLISVQRRRQEQGYASSMPSLHLVFTGNPGTGKTTVARIMGRIYYGLGLLSSEKVVESDRSDLVSNHIGETALKTQEKIKDAMNGILFIDEAYTLAKQDNSNDFGQEAIDTLLKQMEDKRDRLAVIVAGYTEAMTNFINSNAGLESRFTRIITFEDYSHEELMQIFLSLAHRDKYELTPEATDKLSQTLTNLVNNKNHQFGNGRTIRNLFEKTVEKQAVRLAHNLHLPVHIFEASDIPEA